MDAMDFNFSVLSTEYARYYFGLSSVRHQPSKAISTQYLNTVTTSGRKSVGTGVPIAGSVPVTATAMNRAPSNLNEYQPPRINQMSPFMRELPGPVNHNSNNSNISSSGSKEQTAFYSSSRAMSSSAIALASSPIKEDSPDLLNMSKMVQSTSNSSIGIPLQTGQTASPSYTAFPDAGIEDEEDDSENNSLYVRGKRVSSYSINSPPITANVGI